MSNTFREAADAVLKRAVTAESPVPGVVAMVTDRTGNVYEGAAGNRQAGGETPMTTEDVFALSSTTKAVTATAALQLVEEERLDLDLPAKHYLPALGKLQVIEGFDAAGEPILRAPKRDISTRMLLTHTAGFGYDFFNETYKRLAEEKGQPSVLTGSKEALNTPLLFDPGERWEYGSSLDWCGQVVEEISGDQLGDVFCARIFEPLGIETMTFELDDSRRAKLAGMHARNADGSLSVMDFELPPPEIHMGGHGLYGTVGDYMRFIRMWLNDGDGPTNPVLRAETVRMAVQNHIGQIPVTPLSGAIAALANDAEFFPGTSKSWSLAFMINNEQAPTGRPAGAQGWVGLANLFYWIDRQTGYGGLWATQILPFGDATSFGRYLEFESALYESLA
jgi:methyl acetate hydrolase